MILQKCARVALENAASIAGMLLTTETVIAEEKKDEPMPMPGGGGMGWRNANDVSIK